MAAPFPQFFPGDAAVPEVFETTGDEMGRDALADQLLIREDGGEFRLLEQVPHTDHRDAAAARAAAQREVEAPGDDAITLPTSEPDRVLVILPAFLGKDAPGTVETEITADSKQDFAAINLRGLNDQGDARLAAHKESVS